MNTSIANHHIFAWATIFLRYQKRVPALPKFGKNLYLLCSCQINKFDRDRACLISTCSKKDTSVHLHDNKIKMFIFDLFQKRLEVFATKRKLDDRRSLEVDLEKCSRILLLKKRNTITQGFFRPGLRKAVGFHWDLLEVTTDFWECIFLWDLRLYYV